MVAATDGHDEIVGLLLERGAAVNAINGVDGTTALMWAANGGWMSVVRRLLAAGARPSIAAGDGWTAVEAARMAGHDDIVKLLEEGI
jgi:ankyrin repeat protein